MYKLMLKKQNTDLQNLQTNSLPFPQTNNRLMLRTLLLLTIGLTIGATRVVSSPGALASLGGVAHALAGTLAGASSSSEASETLSMSMYSSSTGVGRTGVGRTGAHWTGAHWAAAAEGLDQEQGATLGHVEDDA